MSNIDFIINFRTHKNYCRAHRDPDANKIIMEAKRVKKGRRKNQCIVKIMEEFPDTPKGWKQCIHAYRVAFEKVFVFECDETKEIGKRFLEGLKPEMLEDSQL